MFKELCSEEGSITGRQAASLLLFHPCFGLNCVLPAGTSERVLRWTSGLHRDYRVKTRPSHTTGDLTTRGNVETEVHTGGTSCAGEGRDQGNVHKPRNTQSHRKTIRNWVRGLEQALSHSAREGPALLRLDPGLPASGAETIPCSCLSPVPVVLCYSSPGKLILSTSHRG